MGRVVWVSYWGDSAEETLFSFCGCARACGCMCVQFANTLLHRQLTLSLVSFSDNTLYCLEINSKIQLSFFAKLQGQ